MSGARLKKNLIYAGLAVLLLADVTFAYLSSKITANHESPQQTLQEQRRQLELMKLDVKHASEVRANIPRALKFFDEFEKGLPTAVKGYSTIDQELSQFAKDTHLQVAEQKFHEKELAGRNLNEIEIEETVTGDYKGIVTFLNHLQRSKNTYIIDGLQLDSENNGQAPPGSLKIDLKLLTYFRKA